MKDLFVPYELAVKLKEKGFNERCLTEYSTIDKTLLSFEVFEKGVPMFNNKNSDFLNKFSSAPLWQQVIDWLEAHKKYIRVFEGVISSKWYFEISDSTGTISYFVSEAIYKDKYLAVSHGVEKALELI